jgi:MFS family permease
LLTLRAAVDLALLSVGLPLFNRLLDRRRTQSAYTKDLLISRLSVALFAIGSLAIALAPSVSLVALGIIIFALGSGFPPAARSLATSFVRQDETGLLYTALALTQTIGGLTAGPVLALSFEWALNHLGREWTGVPFAIVAGLFTCGFLALSFVRL